MQARHEGRVDTPNRRCNDRALDCAVTFDLDGTLVDLRSVYVRAHQVAAREVLSRELEAPRVLELMKTGLPIRAHMALLDESSADRLVEVFVACYRYERERLVQAFPGMLELTGRLRETGVGIAVVTSKLRADALEELAGTGFLRDVSVVVAFEDTEAHKPDPAPQLAALRALDASCGVGVGDLPTDVESARAAGLAAIGVSWGYGAGPALLEAGAACVCDSAEHLEVELRELLAQAAISFSKRSGSSNGPTTAR
jgi:pyrophosphatase PpaX